VDRSLPLHGTKHGSARINSRRRWLGLARPRFNSLVAGLRRERIFVWYLADAPRDLYVLGWRIPPIQGVPRALIDCAPQQGFDLGCDGSTLLHAAPEGGDKLIRFYGTGCGMTRVLPGSPAVSTSRYLLGQAVDRYFHFTTQPVGSLRHNSTC
jgi:hypothetical protein